MHAYVLSGYDMRGYYFDGVPSSSLDFVATRQAIAYFLFEIRI